LIRGGGVLSQREEYPHVGHGT